MKYLLLAFLLIGCGELNLKGEPGKDGAAGEQGQKGDTGPAGPSGAKGDTGAQGESGAKGDEGEKGDTGDTGAPGQDGEQGPVGPEGPAGADGSTITFVTPCSRTPVNPNTFPEVLMCVANKLYGVYAVTPSGRVHWTYLPPATYRTTDGRNCTFTVAEGCSLQ